MCVYDLDLLTYTRTAFVMQWQFNWEKVFQNVKQIKTNLLWLKYIWGTQNMAYLAFGSPSITTSNKFVYL